MIATTIAIICIALSGFFKAVSDTLDDHFDVSIFKWKDKRFWKPDISWEYVGYLKVFGIKTSYHPDAWHISNSFIILFFTLAAIIDRPHLYIGAFRFAGVASFVIELIIAGVIYIQVFNLFYDHILKSKKK